MYLHHSPVRVYLLKRGSVHACTRRLTTASLGSYLQCAGSCSKTYVLARGSTNAIQRPLGVRQVEAGCGVLTHAWVVAGAAARCLATIRPDPELAVVSPTLAHLHPKARQLLRPNTVWGAHQPAATCPSGVGAVNCMQNLRTRSRAWLCVPVCLAVRLLEGLSLCHACRGNASLGHWTTGLLLVC